MQALTLKHVSRVLLTISGLLILPTLSGNTLKDQKEQTSAKITAEKKLKVDILLQLANKVKDSSIYLSNLYAEEAVNVSRQINYAHGEGSGMIYMGLCQIYKHQYLSSLRLFYKSMVIAEGTGDSSLMIKSLKCIGFVFQNIQNYPRAISYFNKAFRLAKNQKDTVNQIGLFIGLGSIFSDQGYFQLSFTKFYNSIYLCEKVKDYYNLAGIYRYIGTLYLHQNNLDFATYYYNKALQTFNKCKSYGDRGSLYTLLSHIYFLRKDYKRAIEYTSNALLFRKKNNQEDLYASSLLNLGNLFLAKEKYDSAYYYFSAGLKIANKLSNTLIKQLSFKNLYTFYSKIYDWQNALIAYQLYKANLDTLSQGENTNEINSFEYNQIIYENEKINSMLRAENLVQKTQLRNNQIEITILEILLVISFIIIGMVFKQYSRTKKEKVILEGINSDMDVEMMVRQNAAVKLEQSENLHHFLTDQSLDVIARINGDNRYLFISPSCLDLFGFDQEEMTATQDAYSLIDPGSMDRLRAEFNNMITDKVPAKFIYQTRRKNGSLFWAESHVNPIFDPETGKLKEMTAVIRDISKRVEYEEALLRSAKEQDLLMREIHHRAKNNFAVLISLMNIQKLQTKSKDLKDKLSTLQSRVRTMSLIHEQLYKSKSVNVVNFREYISNLTNIISTAYKQDEVQIHNDIADCTLNIETALPLGLVMNEIITNSYKYAFTEKGLGNIFIILRSIPLRTDSNQNKPLWELTIYDDGIGLPDNFDFAETNTLGSQIIETLISQIYGKIIVSGKEGVRYIITFQEVDSEA